MTIVAEGSNSTLAIMAEATLGVTPGTPHFTKTRHTAAVFNPKLATAANDDIVGGSQGAGTKLTALDGMGAQSFNVVIGAHPLQEMSALRSAAGTTGTISCTTTVAYVAATGTITLSGANLGAFSVLIPGMVILIAGSALAANNGFKTILTVPDANSVTVLEALADDTADSAEINWAKQTTGTAVSSIVAEHSYASPSLIRLINGIVAKSWTFSAATRGLVAGKFDFLTLSQTHPDASVEDTTYAAATGAALDILNSTQNLTMMSLSVYNADGTHDAALSNTFKSIDFSVDNSAEYVDAIGEGLFPVGIVLRDVMVKATIKAYYRSKNTFEAAIAQSKLTLRFALTDGTNYKFFCIPMCDILDHAFDETKKTDDGMVTISLQARIDTYVTNESLIISEHMAA